MARSSFTVNRAGVRKLTRELARNAAIPYAEQSAMVARQIAPVDTGLYQSRIRVEDESTVDEARAVVVADVDYAVFVEARDNILGRSLST
jgi:hypothetical protein